MKRRLTWFNGFLALLALPLLIVYGSILHAEITGTWMQPHVVGGAPAAQQPTPSPSICPPSPSPICVQTAPPSPCTGPGENGSCYVMDSQGCLSTNVVCPPTPTPPPPSPAPEDWTLQGGGYLTSGHLATGCASCPAYETCTVTNLNDSGAGSLRNCVSGSGEGGSTHTKPRLTVFAVTGVIPVCTAVNAALGCSSATGPIIIRSPYQTIDGYTAGSPGIEVREARFQDDIPVFQIVATHDIRIRDIKFAGAPSWPGGFHNNSAVLTDSGVHTSHAWDDKNDTWHNVQNVLYEHNVFRDFYDDAGAFYASAWGVTFQFNLSYNNFHPATRGAPGWRGYYCNPGPPASGVCPAIKNACPQYPNNNGTCFEHRERISDIQNVWWHNGERSPIHRRGSYLHDQIQNITGDWRDFSGQQGNGPGGYGAANDNPPNWWFNGIGNLFIAPVGTTFHATWDCINGSTNNAPVDSRWDKQHWSLNWFVQGHNPNHCKSRPIDAPPGIYEREYPLPDLTKNPQVDIAYYQAIITNSGTRFPDSRDLQVKADVNTYYLARFSE